MKQVAIETERAINMEALDADLRAAIGVDYLSVSKNRRGVVIYLADGTDSLLVQEARTVLLNHDAHRLSPAQEAEKAREQALASARASHAIALDLADFSQSDADVQSLADVVAWLEQEIRDLRDL